MSKHLDLYCLFQKRRKHFSIYCFIKLKSNWKSVQIFFTISWFVKFDIIDQERTQKGLKKLGWFRCYTESLLKWYWLVSRNFNRQLCFDMNAQNMFFFWSIYILNRLHTDAIIKLSFKTLSPYFTQSGKYNRSAKYMPIKIQFL